MVNLPVQLTQLQAEYPGVSIPPALAALDPGFVAVSARQARQGLIAADSKSLPALTPDTTIRTVGDGPDAPPLVFCFVVSGRPIDRVNGIGYTSSWVPFDQSFRGRRDALSRCLTAALWSRPAVADGVALQTNAGASKHSESIPAVVYNDREVWLLFEESPVRVVKVTSDWARCIGAGTSPTEKVLLTAFDEAVRGRRAAAGLTLDPMRYSSVRTAIGGLLQQHKTAHTHCNAGWTAAQHVVLELHDSQDLSLPVYSIAPESPSAACSSSGVNLGTDAQGLGSVIVAL